MLQPAFDEESISWVVSVVTRRLGGSNDLTQCSGLDRVSASRPNGIPLQSVPEDPAGTSARYIPASEQGDIYRLGDNHLQTGRGTEIWHRGYRAQTSIAEQRNFMYCIMHIRQVAL
jgi:hypothetical protein